MKNIIYIQGIFSRKKGSKIWRELLEKYYPNDKIIIFDKMYFYTQHEKLNKEMNKIEKVLVENKETIIYAHSFGGILAIASYFKNLKNHRDNIKKIITTGSPHQLLTAGLKSVKKFLGYQNKNLENIEIKTYGGTFDHVVLNKYAQLKDKKHHKIKTFHLDFLLNKKVIEEIIKKEV